MKLYIAVDSVETAFPPSIRFFVSVILFVLSINFTAFGRGASVLGDSNDTYPSGSYLATVSPYNKGSYVYLKDFTESIRLTIPSFPSNSEFRWNWPNVPASHGVYNFIAIDYGDYYNTNVPMAIPPKQIGNIKTLTESHDLIYSGMVQDYDVIDDIFLTTESRDNTKNAFEIEVFLHTPKYSESYVRNSKRIGNFKGSSINWIVAIAKSGTNPPDILFMPDNEVDVDSQVIDIKAMLVYLMKMKIIPSTVYFNGFAFGSETRQGSGSVTVKSFSTQYE